MSKLSNTGYLMLFIVVVIGVIFILAAGMYITRSYFD